MRRAAGFTLVEVMVAITVFSLVMMITVSGLRTFGNTQGSVDRLTDRVDEIRTVSNFLRDTMESAVISSDLGGLTLGGGNSESAYFNFGEGFVEWKSIVLFGEAFGGPYIVRVAGEEDQLVLRWQEEPPFNEPANWELAPMRVLVEDVEEFHLQLRPEFGAPWTNEWRTGDEAPALVRMQIKSAGRYWPDLIMKVQR